MDGTQLTIAFAAGALAFLSPCSLPMLPAYVSYTLERGDNRLLSGLALSAAMVLGFMWVFVVIGLVPSLVVSGLMSFVWVTEPVIGVGLVTLGIVTGWSTMLERLQIGGLALDGNRLSFLFYGVAYGIASLGCSLPVFLMIMLQGVTASGVVDILTIFAAYGAGAAALIIPLTLSLSLAKGIIHDKLLRMLPYVKRINAVVLIAAGAYMIYSGIMR
jgi:cytochrome c-type biogenesis protein